MEGKVELSIERYEELTALERNIGKKLDEIDELKGKLVSEDAVLYRWHEIDFHWGVGGIRQFDGYEYKGRDEAISDLVKSRNAASKEKDDALADIRRYTSASFSDRLRYLFTGKL